MTETWRRRGAYASGGQGNSAGGLVPGSHRGYAVTACTPAPEFEPDRSNVSRPALLLCLVAASANRQLANHNWHKGWAQRYATQIVLPLLHSSLSISIGLRNNKLTRPTTTAQIRTCIPARTETESKLSFLRTYI